MKSCSKFLIFLVIFTAVRISNTFEISSEQIDLLPGMKIVQGNYSRNMTDEQLRYVVNSISSAERQFNQSELGKIAQTMAKNLATVFGNPWTVLVLNKTVQQIGSSVFAYRNKTATFIRTGKYEFSYVVAQKAYCIYPDSYFNMNSTDRAEYFPSSMSTKQQLKTLVYSASTYGGDDILSNADYLKTQATKALNADWSAVLVSPAVTSGSYMCVTYKLWGLFVNNADFGWNYYLFDGD